MIGRFAITEWLGSLVVVEVEPAVFDGSKAAELYRKLQQHFAGVNVLMITPDWEAEGGIRIAGLAAPIEALADADLEWREFLLHSEDELPF